MNMASGDCWNKNRVRHEFCVDKPYYNPVREMRNAKTNASEALAELLEMLPAELQEEYAPLITMDTQSEEYRIVKAADKLAAYIKSIEEVTSGNGEFRKAKQSIEKELKKYEMPEVNYFLKECVPAFSLTLDELDLEEL